MCKSGVRSFASMGEVGIRGSKRAKGLIEGLLREKGIGYDYSVMSKFAIFRAGKLPELKSAAFEVYLGKFVNVELSILRITTSNYSNYQS
ncbi:hypothetical protein Droror1_Dr00011798 [Drosera rotundifolia]